MASPDNITADLNAYITELQSKIRYLRNCLGSRRSRLLNGQIVKMERGMTIQVEQNAELAIALIHKHDTEVFLNGKAPALTVPTYDILDRTSLVNKPSAEHVSAGAFAYGIDYIDLTREMRRELTAYMDKVRARIYRRRPYDQDTYNSFLIDVAIYDIMMDQYNDTVEYFQYGPTANATINLPPPVVDTETNRIHLYKIHRKDGRVQVFGPYKSTATTSMSKGYLIQDDMFEDITPTRVDWGNIRRYKEENELLIPIT